MKISLVVIGDEILLGQVTDTNSGEIARTVSVANWTVSRVFIVGDDAEEIKYAINAALEASDVVITTGGLGPTKDDITKSVLLDIFGGKLIQNEYVLRNVEEVCRRRHIVLNDLTRTQALVPSTARIIQNKVGTAPVMWFEKKCGDKGKVLVTMPGFADTPPPMATVLTPVCLTALSSLSRRMAIIVACNDAARSALFSSIKFGFSFTASRRVYRNDVFSPLKL